MNEAASERAFGRIRADILRGALGPGRKLTLDRLREKLLARSGDYISTVVQESEPKVGKDGLAYLTTQAVVKTREVQKSLNEMSRDDRISFIRNNGDPKVAVRVTTRDADRADAPAQASPIAENLLKERIKSFGFRTWSEEGSADKTADFLVSGAGNAIQ